MCGPCLVINLWSALYYLLSVICDAKCDIMCNM